MYLSLPPRCLPAYLALVFGSLFPSALASQSPSPSDAKKDFQVFCATCHGKTGDGKGVTELDRPARSFLDGGFSFGNTRSALFRSISFGIPGTPMPAFESALSEEQLYALADFVISLGPKRTPTRSADRILSVEKVPVIARGNLPPITEGAPPIPRGLLVGLPTGTTFQYRCDDMRLLGVRQGEFVDRLDWTGRGGQALLPMGKVTWLAMNGTPGPTFEDARIGPLLTRLRRSSTLGGRAALTYDITNKEGRPLATVVESPSTVSTLMGGGFLRHFEIQTYNVSTTITAHVFDPSGKAIKAMSREGQGLIQARDLGDGTFRWTAVTLPDGCALQSSGIALQFRPNIKINFSVAIGDCEEASPEILNRLLKGIF